MRHFKRILLSGTVYIHFAIYAVSAILESVNEILRCDHSNETSIAVFFFTGCHLILNISHVEF